MIEMHVGKRLGCRSGEESEPGQPGGRRTHERSRAGMRLLECDRYRSKQEIFTDHQVLAGPLPNLIENLPIIHPHGTEHGIALAFRCGDSSFVVRNHPSIFNVARAIATPEEMEIVVLLNVGDRRGWPFGGGNCRYRA